ARHFNLPSAEKPATPCLASRIPYGTSVDPRTLQQIDEAERAVRALGFGVLRVRHHGILGRLEVAAEDLEAALQREDEIVARIKQAGYAHAVIDREPFRSGRLNEARARPAASRSARPGTARRPRTAPRPAAAPGSPRPRRTTSPRRRSAASARPGRARAAARPRPRAAGSRRPARRTAACDRPSPARAGRRPRSPRA